MDMNFLKKNLYYFEHYLNRRLCEESNISTEDSVRKATKMIIIILGIKPRTFIVSGRAMIPAPTMVGDRLNTAPEKETYQNHEIHWPPHVCSVAE